MHYIDNHTYHACYIEKSPLWFYIKLLRRLI